MSKVQCFKIVNGKLRNHTIFIVVDFKLNKVFGFKSKPEPGKINRIRSSCFHYYDNCVTNPAIINHLDNLKPEWAEYNLSKGDKCYDFDLLNMLLEMNKAE